MKNNYRIHFLFVAFLISVVSYGQEIENILQEETNYDEVVKKMEAFLTTPGINKERELKFYNRWLTLERHDPKGNIIQSGSGWDEMIKTYTYGKTSKSSQTHGYWENIPFENKQGLGGNQGTGRIESFIVDPTNELIIYVCTEGGLWKTVDGGKNWTPLTDNFPIAINVKDVVIDPNNTQTIYVLSGSQYGNKYSRGVYKSLDGGSTWYSTGLKLLTGAQHVGVKLLIHPTNSNIVYAVTNRAIFRTDDGGITWPSVEHTENWKKTTGAVLEHDKIKDVVLKPNNPNILYAGVSARVVEFDVSNLSNVTYKTSSYQNTVCTSAQLNLKLGVTPAAPDWLYVLTGGSPSSFTGPLKFCGLQVLDMAQTPNALINSTSTPDALSGHTPNYTQGHNTGIVISPTDKHDVLLLGIVTFRSITEFSKSNTTFDFKKYTDPSGGSYLPVHYDLLWGAYHSSGNLYLSSDGGIVKINPTTKTVTNLNANLQNMSVWHFDIDKYDLNYMGIALQDCGYSMIEKGELNYKRGGDGLFIEVEDVIGGSSGSSGIFPKYTYAVGNGTAFYRSELTSSLGSYGNNIVLETGIFYSKLSDDNNDLYTVGLSNITLSTNKGGNFTALTTPTGFRFSKSRGSNIHRIGLSKTNSNLIYLSACHYQQNSPFIPASVNLYKSTNKGNTWTNNNSLTFLDPTSQITSIVVHPNNDNELWLTVKNNTDHSSSINKVLHSVNGGVSWTDISSGLPEVTCYEVLLDDNSTTNSTTNSLYVATTNGVYYKNDNLTDWISFNNNLPRIAITDIALSDDGVLVAASWGRGIWKSDLYGGIGCDYNLALSNTHFSDYEKAENNITSTATVDGSGYGYYETGNSIILDAGFTVNSGGKFIAQVTPGLCTTTIGGGLKSAKQGAKKEYRGVLLGDLPGVSTSVGIDESDLNETKGSLYVYPNPSNSDINIEFMVAKDQQVSISVLDIRGKKIKELDSKITTGINKVVLNKLDYAPGFYILSVDFGSNEIERTKILFN